MIYSYCIPVDDGAAPNPFHGYCTLNICKPRIRKVASVGDWVIGTGSTRSPIGDISGYLVYAMRVSDKFPMEAYDAFAKQYCPKKIVDWKSHNTKVRLGDAIYDYSQSPPALRKSVHTLENRTTDLSGEFTLVSDHFFYFGNRPVQLPAHLLCLVKEGRGHKSTSISAHEESFLLWLDSLGYDPGLYGEPQLDIFGWFGRKRKCARIRRENDVAEEEESLS